MAIFGFPNTGKTTLFNALTGLQAPTARHPYSTTEPNVGVAVVRDTLLERAGELEGSAKTVPTALELLDLPPMAGTGRDAMGGRFLGRLREMDALLGVLRAFEDESVPGTSGTDPVRQAEELMLELALADLEVVRRRLERVAKEATADPAKRGEEKALQAAAQALDEGSPLRLLQWDGEGRFLRDLAPLTLKPVVWVLNLSEDEEQGAARQAVEKVVPAGDAVVTLSAKLEEEGTRLSPDERFELFEGLGLGEGALARIAEATHRALGLVSFYTLNDKEAHAWTIGRGATASEAAGRIHSDLQRGFIRAEVVGIQALLESGGWDGARRAGLVRVEGRDYPVQEGDVLQVRFSI
ncbi:MAG: DUF933 domain-containing protein [Actinomycetota bacterium]|nr:DUF933 domain-containing protein [Actinomycetota bacterium]